MGLGERKVVVGLLLAGIRLEILNLRPLGAALTPIGVREGTREAEEGEAPARTKIFRILLREDQEDSQRQIWSVR